jgi:hypothetical protein
LVLCGLDVVDFTPLRDVREDDPEEFMRFAEPLDIELRDPDGFAIRFAEPVEDPVNGLVARFHVFSAPVAVRLAVSPIFWPALCPMALVCPGTFRTVPIDWANPGSEIAPRAKVSNAVRISDLTLLWCAVRGVAVRTLPHLSEVSVLRWTKIKPRGSQTSGRGVFLRT